VGHGRQAALGDTISNILEAVGYDVVREYYYNDAGRQMDLLGASVRARYLELLGEEPAFPEDGYEGEYIVDVAADLKRKRGASLRTAEELGPFLGHMAVDGIVRPAKRVRRFAEQLRL
jgi:arginyl-tRNA synthetase